MLLEQTPNRTGGIMVHSDIQCNV